ncbi:MAG: 4Fe-4S dicluster domain-containing protein [Planctomycetota bacterium]|nr:MAG: 4Fe-4S dicluster domain-containing protein [Planctomycetota bacterium]
MNDGTVNKYWKSPESRNRSVAMPERTLDESVAEASAAGTIDRRRFLEAAGFTLSLATVAGCDSARAPDKKALPLIEQPEGMVPGRMRYYASTCSGCSAACGLLAGVRDGRPLKMEGNPEHPLSRGGLCAVGQALPLGLYDSHRLDNPLKDGSNASWGDVDAEIIAALQQIEVSGGAVRMVTDTVTSPTLQASIDDFLSRFADARHVTFDAAGSGSIRRAHEKTHGAAVLPHYLFERADVIVSFGADFLGTWISPVEFTAAWRTRRVPDGPHPKMSYHAQLESRMTLTGSNADERLVIRPEEEGLVLSHLAAILAQRAGVSLTGSELAPAPIAAEQLQDLADRLWEARGRSLIVSASEDDQVQILVNFLNHVLGNYGKTLDMERPSHQQQGSDADVAALVKELRDGKVAALLVAGIDLTHYLPAHEKLVQAISQIPLTVSFAERWNDFAQLAKFVCPDHHILESWLDAEPVRGVFSLVQPTVQPLKGTRSILESLATWSEKPAFAQDVLRTNWQEKVFPRQNRVSDFGTFWDQSLHDGFAKIVTDPVTTSPFDQSAVALFDVAPEVIDYTLILHNTIAIPDSRHAHNPWLQELPDPVSKVTWDNYASVAPETAKELSLQDGDVVRIEAHDSGTTIELPAFVQPGQHPRVLSVALGYGSPGTERFANIGPEWLESKSTVGRNGLVGTNAAPLLVLDDERLLHVRTGVRLTKTAAHHALATTQEHDSLDVPPEVAPLGGERRHAIEETTLVQFAANPKSGSHAHPLGDVQLWAEDHPQEGHAWGMAIDLNACSGCSACLIACQSENNVPVVGRDEVRRQREMHWIRIDRYYSGEGANTTVSHQPMMCQHCDNAPCETVCPVLATVHSEEGLNQQVYNRCVGTRYCANNCPYKVRRFNWFDYPHNDVFENLSLNPDVTVRSRGVMEKCSMCVQRIQEAKIESQCSGEPIVDGQIQPACQQTCPASAIVFGDLNDPDSKVSAAMNTPRGYRVLEELNVRPSVGYLRIVRNRETDTHAEDHHDG